MRRWSTAGALALCLGSFNAREAQAGNLDAFYLSGDAALRGGAVVASTHSGSSIWYNPAGLSHLSGSRLDVNVSGYTVRIGARVNFDSDFADTKETRLSLLDLDVVPAAVTLSRRFGDVGVGIGVFVPSQTGVDLRTLLERTPSASDVDQTILKFGYDATTRFQEYHAGPGIGWDPLDTLSIGASLMANYRTRTERTDLSASLEQPSDDGSEANRVGWARHSTLDSQGVELEMILGTQWYVTPDWTLGFVMRTPAFRLGEAQHSIETELLASEDGVIRDNIEFADTFGLNTKVLSPFRFHLGVAWDVDKWSLSAEGSLLTGLESKLFEVTERTTWNARVGARRELNDYWKVGGGLFTDRSPIETPAQFQQARIDYYGATLAVDWTRSFGVFARGEERLEEPMSLLFGTTVALSYAFGLGEIVGARVGTTPEGEIVLTESSSDVIAHELTLNIGSTLGD